jgi:predicted DNA-binding transcriptional regulator YafY
VIWSRPLSRSARLLSLLQAMRGRRGPVTALQRAQSLNVSERTIYRDLAELAAQGAPIEGEAGVGYILRRGLFLKKAAAVALAKIGSVLSAEAQAVLSTPVAIPGPDGIGFPENTVSLADLRGAIRAQKRLEISYIDEQRSETQRFIWPFQLGFMDNARVVVAWCELRRAFRFFRTDRIVSAVAGERYPARRADLLRDFQAQKRQRTKRNSSAKEREAVSKLSRAKRPRSANTRAPP